MQRNQDFDGLNHAFWASVRTISEGVGYSRRGRITAPRLEDIERLYWKLGLSVEHLADPIDRFESFGDALVRYFEYRRDVLHAVVEPNLMDYEDARAVFDELERRLRPQRPFVKNKQKGEKAGPALLTGIVNMLLESTVRDDCDYDPRQLTTFTYDGLPIRTLARRVDGAYPAIINPVAIWEIKEYYFTTTFGSRVADAVYETLLDGLELQALRLEEGVEVYHYLIVDSRRTWWEMGQSYLCRMVDLLQMGYADEILFGREVVTRLPELVALWRDAQDRRGAGTDLAEH